MPASWRTDTLPQLAALLAARPGHEAVRTDVTEILRHGLGVRAADLRQEDYRARVKGRIDTLFASTVFEWKSDLRREDGDVRRRSSTTSCAKRQERAIAGQRRHVAMSLAVPLVAIRSGEPHWSTHPSRGAFR